jgi:hypothetical protein
MTQGLLVTISPWTLAAVFTGRVDDLSLDARAGAYPLWKPDIHRVVRRSWSSPVSTLLAEGDNHLGQSIFSVTCIMVSTVQALP